MSISARWHVHWTHSSIGGVDTHVHRLDIAVDRVHAAHERQPCDAVPRHVKQIGRAQAPTTLARPQFVLKRAATEFHDEHHVVLFWGSVERPLERCKQLDQVRVHQLRLHAT